jgi:uncharacterized Fe-S radical SAM superfamily protein PflX
MVNQRLLNWNHHKIYKILMIFDRLSDDNEIAWNLSHYQSINKRSYLHLFYIYLKLHCQYCQNNSLSRDPSS